MSKDNKTGGRVFPVAIEYIKNNAAIGYSLFLLLLVPGAFFANNYIANSNYEKAIDTITQRKAILAENIFGELMRGDFFDSGVLQAAIDRVMRENNEVISLTVLRPLASHGDFEIAASGDFENVGRSAEEDMEDILAWSRPEGIAFLDQNKTGRFWRVTKAVFDSEGDKIGLVKMSLSLEDSDAIVNSVITDSYWVLALMILVLVLLLANQTRMLDYAVSLNKLKEVDKMKDMFISMASHELRSPLTAIKGYIELMKDDKALVLAGENARYFENIAASSKRLERLVEDMLEVSRLEGNRFPLEISEFDPASLIEQSVEEMRSQAIQKNLALEYEPAEGSAAIKADAGRVKQVVVNLIGNALKYTNSGSVKVGVAVKKNDFLITVADTGIGISSEEQANLFQKFYRVKNEKTRDIVGTGLGLWITMETVRRMKGKITVESIEGVGSHFTVHLPLAKK